MAGWHGSVTYGHHATYFVTNLFWHGTVLYCYYAKLLGILRRYGWPHGPSPDPKVVIWKPLEKWPDFPAFRYLLVINNSYGIYRAYCWPHKSWPVFNVLN